MNPRQWDDKSVTKSSAASPLKIVTEAESGHPSGEKNTPAEKLRAVLISQLRNAVDAASSDLLTYESLRNVSEVISGEYGDRVIFELVQNAHDAHSEKEQGSILLKLVVQDNEHADLYVANTGQGFAWENVNAIRNVGVSSKSVGEGIGNKGLGFRSVETLTVDPRIYSQATAAAAEKFDGFCFRFASPEEVRRETERLASPQIADHVSQVLPRYLAAVPLTEQPEEIARFAKDGFATVIHLPLRGEVAVDVTRAQTAALAEAEVPLLLFLDRLKSVVVEIHEGGSVTKRRLTRKVEARPAPDAASDIDYELVLVGPGRKRYVVARRPVDRDQLLEAVEKSIGKESQLSRWRDWQGQPTVAVAVPLSNSEAEPGRIYNFLPMAAEMPSPISGHVDAPFYATIDRRRASFDLPLNAFLLDQLADTAVRAALELRPLAQEIGRTTIFDFAAWDPEDIERLERACKRLEIEWEDLEVVPAAGSSETWSTLQAAFIWNEKGYKLLRVRRLLKAGIENLADPDLGSFRLQRLEAMLATLALRAQPNENDLSEWLEAVAGSLEAEGSSTRKWGTFYEDCLKALPTVAGLRKLAGKAILRTRDGTINAAMGFDDESPVFVREASGRRKDKDSSPLPPKAIASKFAILDDDVPLAPETVAAFVKAGLVKRYDALEVLAQVPSTFGDRPAPKRRAAALKWAFEVWRAEGAKCEKVLKAAGLYVETRGGWQAGSRARFSEGWTSEGRKLTTYLSETASLSPDCASAADMLLLSNPHWAPRSATLGKQWVEFLRTVGVQDGLPLVQDDAAPKSGFPSYIWNDFLRTPNDEAGRSSAWVTTNREVHLPNPQTRYTRKGELWRFPGQVEHRSLPAEARRRLSELILVQLAHGDHGWLHWHLGRYERWGPDRNERQVLTPAAAFLAMEPWIPVDGDDERFMRPDGLWASTDGRRRPPRYVDRPREMLVEKIESEDKLRSILFAPPIGLRDWSDTEQADQKLIALAHGSVNLQSRERVAFRKAYQQAWAEVGSSELDLPADLPVAVMKSTGPAILEGSSTDRPRIFVTGDPHQPETRAVLAAGEAVLEFSEDALVAPVIEKLSSSGGFDAVPVDPGQVGLLVDGKPMVGTSADALLATDGLDWLPEAAVLANEILGQGLERQISSAAVIERLRRVRIRRCSTIRLSVGGSAIEEALPFYALPDDDHPTLLVGDGQELSWAVLADAAPALSTLLDRRMRALETLLLRLAAHRPPQGPLQRPSDEDLARALGCKIELVREHALAHRADSSLLMERLLPVMACITDLETAQLLQETLGPAPLISKVIEALEDHADRLPCPPRELLDRLARSDLAEVRRSLGLDYGELNRMLARLGRPTLSNENELRRLFETWKRELSPAALDRLRRHFWPDFEAGKVLDRYVTLRDLEFIEFQNEWILEREELGKEDVARLVDEKLEEQLGHDEDRELEPLESLRRLSSRQLQRFLDENMRLMGAWCFANDTEDPWREGSLAVVKSVEKLGLLDFAPLEAGGEIELLFRAGFWPSDMGRSTDPVVLSLDPDDLDGEQERERERREKKAAERRTILFGDVPLDTCKDEFARALADLADARMRDGDWLTRSRRRFVLTEQTAATPRPNNPGRGGTGRPRTRRITDDVRSAMGFASEYLASRFLREKHKERYDERWWVSGNRGRLEVDWDGDDTLGFDFRVQTAEVEWRYEVKSNLDDAFEFEFTQNEMRVAAECSADTTRRYRILYVPFVFDPSRWQVMQLPNPLSAKGSALFKQIGSGATRLRFDIARS